MFRLSIAMALIGSFLASPCIAGEIFGTVVDIDKQAIRHAEIIAVDMSPEGRGTTLARQFSGKHGEFHFRYPDDSIVLLRISKLGILPTVRIGGFCGDANLGSQDKPFSIVLDFTH